ncbi:uncharacterized protein LACBIDRAFT_326279 [Laccaria bicolor S238N-H82]|uniref:Predicted protein n=1 Tax=Laccaria bicolor (strain S238N-H82 / ATCC MYA-4686) TaxID=486041 RepID=B0D7X2_LACBS|nr:uncharacterized protein LACBIDRAFT_326279 [Laccaria bicolor S238N-H82]EDR09717.1 predicted protein [Laccaria bicolor S238N-H82]|eukprot:XP_001880066.1 predicted protein [Laccaria bicolor S238N-H82]
MTCAKDHLNLHWGSDDPWHTSQFGIVAHPDVFQLEQTNPPRTQWIGLHLFEPDAVVSHYLWCSEVEYIGLNDAKMLLSKFLSDIPSQEVYDMRCDVCSGGIGHRQWYPMLFSF